MSRFLITFFMYWTIMSPGCRQFDTHEEPKYRIVITAYIAPGFKGNIPKDGNSESNLMIQYTPVQYVQSDPPVTAMEEKIDSGSLKWQIFSNEDILLFPNTGQNFIVHPGDSIHIKYIAGKAICSGKDADTGKFNLINQLSDIDTRLPKPTNYSLWINSKEDYLQWSRHVDNKLSQKIELLDAYHKKIPASEYEYYKSQIISNAEKDRVNAFGSLQTFISKDSLSGLTTEDLNAIWDSTQNKIWSKWLRELPAYYGSINYIYTYNKLEVWRKFNFDSNNDSLRSKELRTFLYYSNAKQKYKELLRERLMAFILDEQTITEMGLKSPVTQAMLSDYYSQSGYPEYKQWVKELEGKRK